MSGNIEGTTHAKLAKEVVDANNNLIIVEINRFRLAFKIYEKLKELAPEEEGLMEALGSDIDKQVRSISQIILEPNIAKGKAKGEALGLK